MVGFLLLTGSHLLKDFLLTLFLLSYSLLFKHNFFKPGLFFHFSDCFVGNNEILDFGDTFKKFDIFLSVFFECDFDNFKMGLVCFGTKLCVVQFGIELLDSVETFNIEAFGVFFEHGVDVDAPQVG